jgi:GTP-binding nuclear protein Ran
VGDGGVGKTTFCRKLMGEGFATKYIATLGVEVCPIATQGPHVFNVWDCAGVEKFGGLRDGYYIKGECAIVMYDCTNPDMTNVVAWENSIRNVCGNIPILRVGNKSDLGNQCGDVLVVSTKNDTSFEHIFATLKHML